jgi:hypothetical protein
VLAQLLLFKLDDLGELFLNVGLEILDNCVEVDLLVDDSQGALVLESRTNQGREQDIFEALIEEVRKGQIAKLLYNAVLSPL